MAGHEVAGVVAEVGAKVTKVKVGDHVGLGVIHDSCMDCPSCNDGEENYCQKGMVEAYDSDKAQDYESHIGGNMDVHTLGGYSGSCVVHERFVLKLPEEMPLEKVGPILCAGITVYDPLRYWGATKEGKKMCIGVAGIGGLGTMGLKLAKSLGHRVVAISSSDKKEKMALEKGADAYVNSSDYKSMNEENGKIDLIINTISASHSVQHLMQLLTTKGIIVNVGVPTEAYSIQPMEICGTRKTITTSFIGGMAAQQELIDHCFKHQVYPDVQIVEAKDIDDCWQKLDKGNTDGIRYVLDVEKSLMYSDPKEFK